DAMVQAISTKREETGNLFPRAFREALIAGAVALGLFILFIGLKTDQNIRNALIIVPRWGMLATFVALAMIGRSVSVDYIRPFLPQQKIADAATGLLPDSAASRFFRLHYFTASLVVAAGLYGLGGPIASAVGTHWAVYVSLLRGLAVIYALASV